MRFGVTHFVARADSHSPVVFEHDWYGALGVGAVVLVFFTHRNTHTLWGAIVGHTSDRRSPNYGGAEILPKGDEDSARPGLVVRCVVFCRHFAGYGCGC